MAVSNQVQGKMRSGAVRLGFLALTDAAPLLVAQELGFFSRVGLAVQLSREVGWATIRDKVIYGELDAAHALAPMLWAVQLGLGGASTKVCTGLVLNLHGNAITLSEKLWRLGVRDLATLRAEALQRRGENKLTFGVVFHFSSHHLHLQRWLTRAGLDPARDVRIVVVPPAQMARNLAAGTLDGYCAGEPWNTVSIQRGEGWCIAWSPSLAPGHVEKVLMVRDDFAAQRAEEHGLLVGAVTQAAAWCDEPENRGELATLLASRAYLDIPAKMISPALSGRFDCGHGHRENIPDFHIFSRGQASVPTEARAAAMQAELVSAGLIPRALANAALPRQLFREDLHRQGVARFSFDPGQPGSVDRRALTPA